jgi:DNA-binding NarL/FixJ family response regulator
VLHAQPSVIAGADAAVIDLGSAMEALEWIEGVEAGPAVVLLAHDEHVDLGPWLAAGFAVLPHQSSVKQIAAAVQAAAVGLLSTTTGLLRSALRQDLRDEPHDGDDPVERLTPREIEVLTQMSQGLGNREIAARLRISPHTAKFHVAQIIAKLDASSRAHAVAKGLRFGLVAL